MAPRGRTKDGRLAPNRVKAARLFAAGHKVGEIAEQCRISTETLRRWRQDSAFQKAVDVEVGMLGDEFKVQLIDMMKSAVSTVTVASKAGDLPTSRTVVNVLPNLLAEARQLSSAPDVSPVARPAPAPVAIEDVEDDPYFDDDDGRSKILMSEEEAIAFERAHHPVYTVEFLATRELDYKGLCVADGTLIGLNDFDNKGRVCDVVGCDNRIDGDAPGAYRYLVKSERYKDSITACVCPDHHTEIQDAKEAAEEAARADVLSGPTDSGSYSVEQLSTCADLGLSTESEPGRTCAVKGCGKAVAGTGEAHIVQREDWEDVYHYAVCLDCYEDIETYRKDGEE